MLDKGYTNQCNPRLTFWVDAFIYDNVPTAVNGE